MANWVAGGGPRGLYAIVDPAQCAGRDPLAIADAVLEGGCAVLQLRDKRSSDAELRQLGAALSLRCRSAGVPFVVNDRIELAAALDADGLHLGQDDAPVERARAELGALPIGLSTHSLAQAVQAQQRGADLVGFGPVFPTRSKRDPDPVVGLGALAEACQTLSIPVVAIGGIDRENIAQVAASGARLAAVISALCGAADPAAAAAALHGALTQACPTAATRSDTASPARRK